MTISREDLCRRFRELWVPVVCDAMYQLGIAEPVLPSWLRPLIPDQRIAGIAFTVLGRGINPPVAWDEGVERISSYLHVFEQLQPDDLMVSVTTEKAIRLPNSSPTTVTTGIRIFFKRCTPTMRCRERPLARANLM